MSHLKSVKKGVISSLPTFTIKGDYTPVPDGEYTVTIKAIQPDRYKNTRDCIRFTFEICEGQYVGRLLKGWVNIPLDGKPATTNMKLVRWYQAALGCELAEDDVINLDDIVGYIVRVSTKTTNTRFKNQFSNVSEILSLVMPN